jgi:LAO/AO transport system kinase
LIRVLRSQEKKVGILAIDPTSPFSGGAILGDRIRMQSHYADPSVFIRSMATRGRLGGLAPATADLTLMLDAAGFDVILIETVGVGQDEVDVARLADAVVVVLAPGFGDDVQAMKAGMLEIADVYVVNKADLAGADKLELDLQFLLGLAHRADGWSPPIVRCVASEGEGIDQAIEAVERFCDSGLGKQRTVQNWIIRLREMYRERLVDSLPAAEIERAAGQITRLETDPYSIVEKWASTSGMSHISIDHLGIAVRSIDEALPFYRDALLRNEAISREVVPHEGVTVAMAPIEGSRIELLEPLTADSVIGRFLAKRGPGLHHVAFRVADLAATVERLKQTGARLLNEPKTGAGGHLYVFVHPASTGGVLIELVQEQGS